MSSAAELRIAPLTLPADDLSRFIADVYDTYDHGVSFVPRWSGPFLKRVVLDHPDRRDGHALSAYLGDNLVGVLMAQPQEVWFGSSRHPVAHSSWLAVKPEGARHFAAPRLINEQRERLRQSGVDAMFGLAYRSGRGVGLDFWEGFARAFPKEIVMGPDLPFWARVLDGRGLAPAVKDPLMRAAAQLAMIKSFAKPPPDPKIRAYRTGDLEACGAILSAAATPMRLAPSDWDLRPAELPDGGPQTLVIEVAGSVGALCSYHILPMEDAGPLRIAMVELLNAAPGVSGLTRLLSHALWQAKAAGASLALIPRKPHLTAPMMVSAGFVPYQAGFRFVYMPLSDNVPQSMPATYDLLVR